MKSRSIAALLTCFNRADKTLDCLERLFRDRQPESTGIEIFLVDDGSSDGTSQRVAEKFPQVHLIQGTGSLFWCGGMRLAWETAAAGDFDFYLWLNDDTMLFPGAIAELLATYDDATDQTGADGIVVAACCNPETGQFSYGGKNRTQAAVPNGELQTCIYVNGNCVLVPRTVFKAIGGLSKRFTHGIGDREYGLRAIANGFRCWTTRRYLAACSKNPPEKWSNPATPLAGRFKILYGPLGLNLPEYVSFLRAYPSEPNWLAFFLRANFKALCPRLYGYLKRKTGNAR